MIEVPTKYITDGRRFDLEVWINDVDDTEISSYFYYRVELYDYSRTDIDIQHQYIRDNLQGIWAYTGFVQESKQIYLFQNENDAILFKLRWG